MTTGTRPWTRVSFVSPTGTHHYSTLVESLALNDTIHSENFYRIENLAVTALDDKCTVNGKTLLFSSRISKSLVSCASSSQHLRTRVCRDLTMRVVWN